MATILCVDDESSSLEVIEEVLSADGHRTVGVNNVHAAFNVLSRGGVDLIVSDFRMPDLSGLEFLGQLEETGTEVGLIMLTGFGSIEHAVASLKAGAVDYITKPVRPEELQLAVNQALELIRLRGENDRLQDEVNVLEGRREIVGDSPALRRILDTIEMVAPTPATVLLEGESGTGKELLARTIHRWSGRKPNAFVSLNCAALPESLVESILFGHERGAFTGADRTRKGAFERADGGTLLLDEISEMRLDLQAKLLRVLQEGELERVGGTAPIDVDVRVVATTNRDLREEARKGTFREDLFYRLSVVPVRVPRLRERRDDIPALVTHFARRAARKTGRTFKGVAPEVMDSLQKYHWPGNVRELAHAVERAIILMAGEELCPQAFDSARHGLTPSSEPFPFQETPSPPARTNGNGNGNGSEDLDVPVLLHTLNLGEVEQLLIERALHETNENRTQAAKLLGLNVRTLRGKLNRN